MELSKYLEYNIYKSKVFSKILSSQQIQIDNLSANLIDLENQAYICSATWGLKYWEQELGLNTVDTDTIEDRRSRCLAKIRGYGNLTIEKMDNICSSYVEKANIKEDFENYRFTIDLTNNGFSQRIIKLIELLKEIKPAHLIFDTKFTSISNDSLIFKTSTLYGEEIKVFPFQTTKIEAKGKLNVALGNTQNAEIINVKPLEEE